MTEQQEQVGLRESATIAFPGTEAPGTAWDLYNQMIAGIPEGVLVRDYCLGLNWSYVEADCGMGVAFTVRGGGKRTYKIDLRGMELRQVAELSKSWCFQEATLGIAALNAWYSRRELLAPLGCEYVMPQADYAFITGVTLINKTAPRLLDLARRATTVMVGPSVVMTPALFERGVHELAGSVVNDPERAKFAVANGGGQLFGQALVMAGLKAE